MAKTVETVIRQILRDIEVELGDEFDKNFERQAFFGEAWQRRKSPVRPGGHILLDTGQLRRSVTSRISGDSIVFASDLPYAGIHNEGGEIKVTAKMKRYFWYRYYAATGSFGRRKDGKPRQDRRTTQLGAEADFWKAMALMKEGSAIQIPRRRFIGASPEVESAVREIITENIEEYIRDMEL